MPAAPLPEFLQGTPAPPHPHLKTLSRPWKKRQPRVGGAKQKNRPECFALGCTTQPKFNIAGTEQGLYCVTHKEHTMVNVMNPKCAMDGCSMRPRFNMEGSPRGLYCGDHRKTGMVNVMHRRCQHDGCIIQPSFNLLGEKGGRYCSAHAIETMIDVVSSTAAPVGGPRFSIRSQTGCQTMGPGMVSRQQMKKQATQ